jgi:2-polyprenyl-3-methyl-5-hydroxy-6-metoxy-1,4-benzoquinol methylase
MAIDQSKLESFLGKLITDMGAAVGIALTYVGDQLGIYKAMAGAGPLTPSDLAAKTGYNERLLQEWLNTQAAGGYVSYDSRTGRYELPEEQAFVLTDADSPVYMGEGALAFFSVMHAADEKMKNALRTGSGIHWKDHDRRLFEATERFFRPGYRTHLTNDWIPALTRVADRLKAGALVADVGCGHAASTIVMAQAYPASRFVAIDSHPGSIKTAKQRVADAGVSDRVDFEVARANEYKASGFDLVCFMDCLHDMGDPVGAARHAREALKPGGAVMLVEPFANDKTAENFTPLGRMFYGASTYFCCANSVAQGGAHTLGAQAGEANTKAVFEKAGYSSFKRATETPFNIVYEARP